MNVDTTKAWGKSDQKMILVNGIDFSELHEHLQSGKWVIESVSACAAVTNSGGQMNFQTPYTYAYVTLERN